MPENVIRDKLAAEEAAKKTTNGSNLQGIHEDIEPWFGNSSALDAFLQQPQPHPISSSEPLNTRYV